MRFWVFDKRTKKILGPYSLERFRMMPGLLTLDTKVAPEGATRVHDWRKVRDVPVLKTLLEAVGTAENPEIVEPDEPTPPPKR